MKKLRIGYDAKRLFHNHTGLGNYSRTLLRNLQAKYPQHEYHLFAPNIIGGREVDYFLDDSKFIIHNYKGKVSPYWRSRGITSWINNLDLDIYHGLSHEIPMNSKKLKAKSIVTFHDLIYEHYPEQFNLWDRYMYRKKYRHAAAHADHVVAISESTKKDLINLYQIEESKISVVYQSCNPAFNDTLIPNNKTNDYYLYVGSLIERKSFLLIVEAYNQLRAEDRLPFKVIGNGGLYADRVKQKIEQYNLMEWFEFLTHVDNSALVATYDNALGMVYPSIYEGFGIPLIESLYRKTPVITTNSSSLPEAAGPGAIYIDPDDVDQLCKALVDLKSEEKLRNNLASEGYQYVKTSFDPATLSDQMMDIYFSI